MNIEKEYLARIVNYFKNKEEFAIKLRVLHADLNKNENENRLIGHLLYLQDNGIVCPVSDGINVYKQDTFNSDIWSLNLGAWFRLTAKGYSEYIGPSKTLETFKKLAG